MKYKQGDLLQNKNKNHILLVIDPCWYMTWDIHGEETPVYKLYSLTKHSFMSGTNAYLNKHYTGL